MVLSASGIQPLIGEFLRKIKPLFQPDIDKHRRMRVIIYLAYKCPLSRDVNSELFYLGGEVLFNLISYYLVFFPVTYRGLLFDLNL